MPRITFFNVFFLSIIAFFIQNARSQEKEMRHPFGWWPQTNVTSQTIEIVTEADISWTILDRIDHDFRRPYGLKSFAAKEYYDIVEYLNQRSIDIVQLLELETFDGGSTIDTTSPELNLPPDLVEHYNNVKDYVTTYKGSIQHWMPRHEMGTLWRARYPFDEETMTLSIMDWVILYRLHYKAIKEADPDAKIILGAFWFEAWFDDLDNPFVFPKRDIALEFLDDLKYLEDVEKGVVQDTKYLFHPDLDSSEYALLISPDNHDQYFDIIGNSHSSSSVELEEYTKRFPQLLADKGYPDIPIWMHDNWLSTPKVYNQENCLGMCIFHPDAHLTEIEGAQLMLTKILVAIPYVERVNLNYGVMIGWVDSLRCGEYAAECGYKRLVYYAYRKFIEKLKGFTSVTKIDSTGFDRIYQFSFQDKSPVWVAFQPWSQSDTTSPPPTTLTLHVGNLETVRITKAIPNYQSGRQIADYDSAAFETKVVNVSNGNVEISLDRNPVFVEASSVTSVEEGTGSLVPKNFKLEQNYPNPFNPQTTIEYQLPRSGHFTLRIQNLLGQEVQTLVDEHQVAGRYSVVWDGKDDLGKDVSSGVYFYYVSARNDHFRKIRKLVLLR